MDLYPVHRRDNTCTGGQQWYVCDSNGFRGCYSVNACDLPSCPHDSISSPGVSLGPTITSASPTQTPRATLSATSRTTSSLATTSKHANASPSVLMITITLTKNGFTTLSQSTSTYYATPTSSSSHQLSSSTSPEAPPPPGARTKAIIAGVVAGVGGAILAGLLIMLWLWVRRRKKAIEEKKPIHNEHGIDTAGPQASGLDTTENSQTNGQNESESRIHRSKVWSLVSSFANSAGTSKRETVPQSPVSAVTDPNGIDWHSSNHEVPTQPELAGPSKDNTPELHDTDSKGRTELPPDPERSLINSPKSKSESPVESMNAESTSSRRSTYAMGSTLNSIQERKPPTGAGGSIPHVMSWMSYDGDAGPQR